jgi:3-oxoacyl-[acyl-carrier-protein] synthase-3
MMGQAGILGVGSALPPLRVHSDEIARRIGVDSGWIERRTGIRERRRAAPGERVSTLAAIAANAALADAGLSADALDAVLVATVTADEIMPAAAPIVAHEIGASHAGAADVGAACAGSVSALAFATAMIEAGRARHVLVAGVDVLSRLVDPDDRRTAPLFGDGAAALVVSGDASGEIGPFVLGSDGASADAIRATRSRGIVEMDGHDTFLAAVDRLASCTETVLERSGLELSDIDLFIYHQANSRILTAVSERLGLARDRVYDCLAELGNTSAASVPLALERALAAGRVRTGDRVLLAAVGSGLVWGATVLTWGRA